MCDFHSCIVRVDGALFHLPGNSHSEAVKAAKWRENEPHKRPVFVEAEWNCRGKYPGAEKICRIADGEKLTAKQRETVDRHYKAVAAIISEEKIPAGVLAKFSTPDFADVLIERFNAEQTAFPLILGRLLRRMYGEIRSRDAEFAGHLPARVIEAIRPGADLSLVWPKFAVWMLTDEAHGSPQ